MKAVLISIKPKWCELIVNGKKTIEVRKTRPELGTPFKCYIYETKSIYSYRAIQNDKRNECALLKAKGRGKVIGEFVCDVIYEINTYTEADGSRESYPHYLGSEELEKMACLRTDEIANYLGLKNGYGWHISDLVTYDTPKELGEFHKQKTPTFEEYMFSTYPNGNYEAIRKSYEIKRPPQSWCYVELEY